MPLLALLLHAISVPHAESPWPESIGLGFPFTVAGAMAMLAMVAMATAPEDRRDRAAVRAAVWGFWAGATIYALLLCFQALVGG